MEEQLPELVNSLEAIRHLQKNSEKEQIETNFQLTEGVYANATIENKRRHISLYR